MVEEKRGRVLQLLLVWGIVGVAAICSAAQQAPIDTFKLESARLQAASQRKLPAQLSAADAELAKKFKLTPAALKNIVKVDLTCQVKAYYDQAHSQPIPTAGANVGVYHIKNGPTRPMPYFAYFEVAVKNQGIVDSAVNVSNRLYFTSPLFAAQQILTPPESIAPGETAEYKYYWGAFGPNTAMLHNKVISIQVGVDYPPHVSEDNEANNVCGYQLRFEYP